MIVCTNAKRPLHWQIINKTQRAIQKSCIRCLIRLLYTSPSPRRQRQRHRTQVTGWNNDSCSLHSQNAGTPTDLWQHENYLQNLGLVVIARPQRNVLAPLADGGTFPNPTPKGRRPHVQSLDRLADGLQLELHR